MPGTTEGTKRPSFEESYPEINRYVQARRASWVYTSVVEWADISQIILIRIHDKWSTYDPARGPLEHWVNRLITNAISNANRDLAGRRLQKPCVGGGRANGKRCVYNLGEDTCAYTPSRKQCAECPLYAEWQHDREHQHNLKASVALEHHSQEVYNIQGDFTDAAEIKDKLDAAMKRELTLGEWRVWDCLYVKHMKPAEASTHLEALVKTWKRLPREDEQYGYQSILQTAHRIKEIAMEWLRREGHI